jgi:lysophospholipase L1-like esterase
MWFIDRLRINDLKTITLFPKQSEAIVQRCKNNIAMLVDLAEQTGAEKIILTSIFPTGKLPFYRWPFWSKDINNAIASVKAHLKTLASENVIYFDTAALLTDNSGRINQNYQQNFLHLSAEGYSILNHNLLPLLFASGGSQP